MLAAQPRQMLQQNIRPQFGSHGWSVFFFSATLVLNCLFLLLDVLGASRLRTVGHMLGNAKHNTRPGLVTDMEKRHGRYVVRKWTEKCVLPCHVLHSDIWQ